MINIEYCIIVMIYTALHMLYNIQYMRSVYFRVYRSLFIYILVYVGQFF